jgi:hypothetical protein
MVFSVIGAAILFGIVDLARRLGFAPFAAGFVFGGCGTLGVVKLVQKLRPYRREPGLSADSTKLARSGS